MVLNVLMSKHIFDPLSIPIFWYTLVLLCEVAVIKVVTNRNSIQDTAVKVTRFNLPLLFCIRLKHLFIKNLANAIDATFFGILRMLNFACVVC